MVKKSEYPSVVLFLSAALLLTAGSLIAAFPIFIFFGFAPLLALTDKVPGTSHVWEKMEWVLFALVIYFLSLHFFDLSYIVSSLLYAILFTLPFIGHVWVRDILGRRVGKITIVFFWLTLEYLLLKIIPGENPFVADTLREQPSWTMWNEHTGYLGTSAWILVMNVLVYHALLSENPFQWYWLAGSFFFLVAPMTLAFFPGFTAITHSDMVNLYDGKLIVKDVVYLARGEFVVRTAAWLSTLILLFTFVKSQTTKR